MYEQAMHIDIPDFLQSSEPMIAGSLIRVEVTGDEGGHVAGRMMQYPDGRIGGLTLGDVVGLDDHELHHLTVLIERCSQGNWHLSGLRRVTPEGSYAAMVVMDAIAAAAERAE